MSGDRSHIGFEVNAELAETFDEMTPRGKKSEVLRRLVRQYVDGPGGSERTALDVKIEQTQEELEALRSDRREADEQIENLEARADHLREERAAMRTSEEKLDDALVGVESELRAGAHIDPEHGQIIAIATELDMTEVAVLDRLKMLNPDVPDSAFEQKMHAVGSWDGLPVELRDTPRGSRDYRYRSGVEN